MIVSARCVENHVSLKWPNNPSEQNMPILVSYNGKAKHSRANASIHEAIPTSHLIASTGLRIQAEAIMFSCLLNIADVLTELLLFISFNVKHF